MPFEAAKQMLSCDKALAHYDVNKPIKFFCDASAYGLGACLVHLMEDGSQKPIAYASCTLSKSEQAYAQIEHDGLAIVFEVRWFHQYLYGRSFTLVTDHRPLCKIFGSKEGIPSLAAARMQRWALTLSAYTVEHIKGTANNCADACQGCHSLGSHEIVLRRYMLLFKQMTCQSQQLRSPRSHYMTQSCPL